jgi:hypothetical protein
VSQQQGTGLLRRIVRTFRVRRRDPVVNFGALFSSDEQQVSISRQLLASIDPWLARVPAATSDLFGNLIWFLNQSGKPSKAREIASIAVLLCHRCYRWGASDLLRGRITATLGYARQEAEATGLVQLFLQQPDTALEWFSAVDEARGRTFYNKHQRTLKQIMTEQGVVDLYERGSAEALHVRMVPALRGHRLVTQPGTGPVLYVLDAELREADPRDFIDVAFWFLLRQADVLYCLAKGFPEMGDQRWKQLLAEHTRRVEGTRPAVQRFLTTRTEQAART